jgi:hypothetical protein
VGSVTILVYSDGGVNILDGPAFRPIDELTVDEVAERDANLTLEHCRIELMIKCLDHRAVLDDWIGAEVEIEDAVNIQRV